MSEPSPENGTRPDAVREQPGAAGRQSPAGYYPPGYRPSGQVPPSARTPWSSLAIAGFIVAFVASLVGLVLSIFGLRDTVRTGNRGGGLAIAGIVVGALRFALDVILVVALVVAGPAMWRASVPRAPVPRASASASPRPGISKDAASFGASDELPAQTLPVGGYQELTSLRWIPQKAAPTEAVIRSVGGRTGAVYLNPAKTCFGLVDVTTVGPVRGTEYDQSHALLDEWLSSPPNRGVKVAGVGVTIAPAFHAKGAPAPATGQYEVVRAAVSFDDGTLGEARARVFDRGDKSFGVLTAIMCDGQLSIAATGREAIGQYLGAAW